MKKVSFDISGEEKNRILEMHQKSTGRQYLNLIKEEKHYLFLVIQIMKGLKVHY